MKKEILVALVWAAIMIPLALAAKYANAHGYIDGDTRLRILAMNGLYIAYLGNSLPKAVVPYAWARQSRRFTGWVLVLSGLVFAGLWAFAPIPLAETVGTGVVFAGVVASLGYCVWLANRAQTKAPN